MEHIVSDFLDLRYRLLSYIYSHTASASHQGGISTRPLVSDSSQDKEALKQQNEYMFGNSLLTNPITQNDVQSWKTYPPEYAAGWIDFWNGKAHEGGQYVDIPISIEKIPVLVKAGIILPLGMKKRYASENLSVPLEIRIYPGEDASFILYEDEGDNRNYEKGAYSSTRSNWNGRKRVLTIEE